MEFDFKRHRCFWVYQNKTFFEEAKGGFLWSPQFARDGKHHPGYEMMKEVKKGDLIFHSIEHAIVAISQAKSDCYASPNPGISFSIWDKEGWQIDVESFYPSIPWIYSKTQGEEMYKIFPRGPFLPNGYGKEQYLCGVDQSLYKYVIEKVLQAQRTSSARDDILELLKRFSTPPLINVIENGCKVEAVLLGQNKTAILTIDSVANPNHKNWLGKKVGDILTVPGTNLSYRVESIYREKK